MSADDTTPMSSDDEPSAESLAEIPEIDFDRYVSLGRGAHLHRRLAKMRLVAIDADLWPRFGSAAAVNAALRSLVDAARTVRLDP